MALLELGIWRFSLSHFLCCFFCFVIIIKYSRAQKGQSSIIPPSLSLPVTLELNSYCWVTEFLVFPSVLPYFLKTHPNSPLMGTRAPTNLGITLGVNSLLRVIGVSFQLYGQLKKNPHNIMGVLGSSAVSMTSQATRLGKDSSVTTRDECTF